MRHKTAEDRAAHAAYVARSRDAKKKLGECRQCTKPAAVSPEGVTMSACNYHLDVDAERAKKRRRAKKMARKANAS